MRVDTSYERCQSSFAFSTFFLVYSLETSFWVTLIISLIYWLLLLDCSRYSLIIDWDFRYVVHSKKKAKSLEIRIKTNIFVSIKTNNR